MKSDKELEIRKLVHKKLKEVTEDKIIIVIIQEIMLRIWDVAEKRAKQKQQILIDRLYEENNRLRKKIEELEEFKEW